MEVLNILQMVCFLSILQRVSLYTMGWKKVIHATDPNQSEIETKYNRVDNYSILTKIQHAHVCECADIYSSLFAKNPTKSLLHVIPYLGILDGI